MGGISVKQRVCIPYWAASGRVLLWYPISRVLDQALACRGEKHRDLAVGGGGAAQGRGCPGILHAAHRHEVPLRQRPAQGQQSRMIQFAAGLQGSEDWPVH